MSAHEEMLYLAAKIEHETACLKQSEALRPSTRLNPRIYIDGNQWCALYGEDLMAGVAGFGRSPEEAFEAFDKAWTEKLPEKK